MTCVAWSRYEVMIESCWGQGERPRDVRNNRNEVMIAFCWGI